MLKARGLKGFSAVGGYVLGTIPAGYRPLAAVTFDIVSLSLHPYRLDIATNGTFELYSYDGVADNNCSATVTWLTG